MVFTTGTVVAIQYEDYLTITFGSILEMNIRKVKKDPEDVTLSIPSAILPGL